MKNSFILFVILIFSSCNIYNNKQLDSNYVATKISNARKYYMDKQYRLGIDELNKLIKNKYFIKEYKTESPKVLYNQACNYALVGNTEKALDYLESSVKHGFSNLHYIEKDNDLYILRNTTRFTKLVDDLKKENELWNGEYVNTPFQPNISDKEKIAGLSKLWYEIKYNYIDYNSIGINLDSTYFEYLNKVVETKSTRDYYLNLKQFVAQLNDKGTDVFFPKELQEENTGTVPVSVQVINNKVVISNILDNHAKEKGINVGDEITNINDIPVKEFASKNENSDSNGLGYQTEKYRISEETIMNNLQDNPIELTVNDTSKNSITYSVKKIEQQFGEPPCIYKRLENNIGYLAINTFTPVFSRAKVDSIFNHILKNDALIIDLRENCESKGNVGWFVLGLLTNENLKQPLWESRVYNSGYRAWGTNDILHGFSPPLDRPIFKESFLKPVVLLTRSKTCGMAEDFCAAFKILNRGKIIGSPTSGSGGNPLTVSLPGGGYARISTTKIVFPNGESTLGKGVQPDILVEPTIEDLRNHVDAALDTAISVLNKQIKDGRFILNPNERRYRLS